ncbi:MAG: metallophosphoesterase family protein [Akkermansiaceae bacterium]|nr:metallophosphoesterase family protein [Akkermansiaceae bacterium]
MRTFAIGDIHGHLTALNSLLAAIPANKDDLLVFLGDYVDKGPDVPGVLNRLIDISESRNAIFLRGNHDQLMLDARKDPALHLPGWECLSGGDPLASYGEGKTRKLLTSVVPKAHFEFLKKCCVNFHETDDFIFVHAGISPDRAPADESMDNLQWQKLPHAAAHQSGKTVICGHTAQNSGDIADLHHTICIDTGITKGLKLTALALDTFEFWQADPEGSTSSGKLR